MQTITGKGTQERAAASGTAEAGESLRRRVQEKAYELFVRRGRAAGHDVEDWLEAERLVLGEIRARGAADRAVRPSPAEIDRPVPGHRPAPAPGNRRRN